MQCCEKDRMQISRSSNQKGRLCNKRRGGLVHQRIHPRAGVDEMEVEERRPEAALTGRRRAARPAQTSAMEIDHASLLPEFDAVYAWTPRDRVIVKRDDHVFWPERESGRASFVQEEELETCILL